MWQAVCTPDLCSVCRAFLTLLLLLHSYAAFKIQLRDPLSHIFLVPPGWRHSPLPAPIALVWSDSCCISVLPTLWCEIFKGRNSLCPGPCVPNRVLAHGGHVVNSCWHGLCTCRPVVQDLCALMNRTFQSPLEVCKITTYFMDEDTEAIIIMM